MKKYILLLLMFLVLPFNVSAKDNFNLNCDKENLNEHEEFTCRTSLSSNFEFNKIVFELDLSKGLSLNELRSNFTSLWKVELKDNLIVAETKGEILVSGLQEFGILLLESNNYGNQKIQIKNIKLINTISTKEKELPNLEHKVKVMSSNNELKSLTIDSKKYNGFKSNIYSYIINVKDEDKVTLDVESVDPNAKLIGAGEVVIDKLSKVTVHVISVKSESGVNKSYILYFVRNIEDHNISIDDINITDDKKNVIEFNFKPDVYEYNIEVGNNIKKLNFEVIFDDKEYSLVKDFGNQTISIEDGDNTILIKVKNSEGEINTYVINITKLLSNKSANYYLKSLKISKYPLKFNKRVKNYQLFIKKGTKKLNINAIAEDETSVVSIIGNDNLTEGSIVKVVVQAENESRFTYFIEINYEKSNMMLNLLYFIFFASVIGGLFELYRKGIFKFKTKPAAVKANDKSKKSKSKKVSSKKSSKGTIKTKPKKEVNNSKITSNQKPSAKKAKQKTDKVKPKSEDKKVQTKTKKSTKTTDTKKSEVKPSKTTDKKVVKQGDKKVVTKSAKTTNKKVVKQDDKKVVTKPGKTTNKKVVKQDEKKVVAKPVSKKSSKQSQSTSNKKVNAKPEVKNKPKTNSKKNTSSKTNASINKTNKSKSTSSNKTSKNTNSKANINKQAPKKTTTKSNTKRKKSKRNVPRKKK